MKKFYWFIFVSLVVYICLYISIDTQNTIYRPNASVGIYDETEEGEHYSVQRHRANTSGEYRLAFVELDDLGIYKNKKQVGLLFDEIQKAKEKSHTLFLIFAHGWHNNASPDSSNVKGFQQLLSQVRDGEQKRCADQGCIPYDIFGIYIAWQGEPVSIPLLRQLTFWHRKQVAQKVGSQGVADLLLEIEAAVSKPLVADSIDNAVSSHSKVIAIGHSFGGAMLFSALHNILSERIKGVARQQNVSPSELNNSYRLSNGGSFGDLVVLINPAFEASQFTHLFDTSQNRCQNYKQTTPNLVILTSETDYATRYLFPVGRHISTFLGSYTKYQSVACDQSVEVDRVIDTKVADTTSIGHYAPFQTHRLDDVNNLAHKGLSRQDWFAQNYGSTIDFGFSKLKHLAITSPNNPFLNVIVDKDLIDGHNDIWRDSIIHFIQCMIKLNVFSESAEHSAQEQPMLSRFAPSGDF